MKVLVTGAAGFIGSHLAERLIEAGHVVYCLDRAHPCYLGQAYKQDNCHVVTGDLMDHDLAPWFADFKPDVVFHLAARAGTADSWGNFAAYLRDNVQATDRLLHWCTAGKVPWLVYVSSSSVYGRIADGDEQASLKPVSPYGITKLAAENLCRAWCHPPHQTELTVIRPFSVYGPRQRPDMFVRIAASKLLDGLPIQVTGHGTQERSLTYVGDMVDALVAVLRHREWAVGRTFNIGGEVTIPLLEVVGMLERVIGRRVSIEFVPPRPGDQLRTKANIMAARSFLKWAPRTPLLSGLGAQVAWQVAERIRLRERVWKGCRQGLTAGLGGAL